MKCMLPTAFQVVIGGCCRCLDVSLQDEGIRGIFLSEGLLTTALPLLAVKDSNSPIDALTTAIADLPDGSILDVDPVRYAILHSNSDETWHSQAVIMPPFAPFCVRHGAAPAPAGSPPEGCCHTCMLNSKVCWSRSGYRTHPRPMHKVFLTLLFFLQSGCKVGAHSCDAVQQVYAHCFKYGC